MILFAKKNPLLESSTNSIVNDFPLNVTWLSSKTSPVLVLPSPNWPLVLTVISSSTVISDPRFTFPSDLTSTAKRVPLLKVSCDPLLLEFRKTALEPVPPVTPSVHVPLLVKFPRSNVNVVPRTSASPEVSLVKSPFTISAAFAPNTTFPVLKNSPLLALATSKSLAFVSKVPLLVRSPPTLRLVVALRMTPLFTVRSPLTVVPVPCKLNCVPEPLASPIVNPLLCGLPLAMRSVTVRSELNCKVRPAAVSRRLITSGYSTV